MQTKFVIREGLMLCGCAVSWVISLVIAVFSSHIVRQVCLIS